MPPPVTLEVMPDLPATAVSVSADWLATPVEVVGAPVLAEIARLEQASTETKIVDRATADAAALLLQQVRSTEKSVETARVQVKARFLDITRKIDDAARAPLTRLIRAKDSLNKLITTFVLAEEEKARKAREAAERKQREEEAAARAKAAADAKAAAEAEKQGALVDVDIDEPAPAPAPLAAPVRPVALAGVRVVKALGLEVVDISKVPEEWLKPRELAMAKVMSRFAVGWKEGDPIPQVPGLKFTASTVTNATGRR